jgi:thiol:disulfide interchange protein DsbD
MHRSFASFRIASTALIALLIAATSFAQLDTSFPGQPGGIPGVPSASETIVTVAGSIQQIQGEQVSGIVTVTIAPAWHINSAHPLQDFSIPTVLTFDSATADLVKADYPPHELKTFAFSGGGQLAVYEKSIRIPFTAKVKAGAKSITAKIRYQACNDNVCLPPKTVSSDIALQLTASPASATTTNPATTNSATSNPAGNSDITATTSTTPAVTPGFTPLANAPKNPELFSSDLGSTFAARGLPLTLLALFVLGIALNLTPCVFPLIPITLGFFAMQSDGRRGRRFALSSFYVLGLVLTYSSLGVLAALSGKIFGAWLQLPGVLIVFALLMLVMASSMFGAFDITVPSFIANRSAGRAGVGGAFIMGLLIGIVAAPCVGPVVVSLIGLVAQIGSPQIGFLMFFVLALGLGMPYLVMLNALPRPGEWMVQVKKAMGFILVAMAFYFLRSLIGETWFHWGVAASLLVGAAFLFAVRGGGPAAGKRVRLVCATLLLAAGVYFALPSSSSASTLVWDSYSERSLAAARAAHKPVIVDFYADWCIPCKELDEKTFSNRDVANQLDHFVRLKANLTSGDDAKTQALTKRYGIIGVPTILLLDADGKEIEALRLTGFEEPEKFRERLTRVR